MREGKHGKKDEVRTDPGGAAWGGWGEVGGDEGKKEKGGESERNGEKEKAAEGSDPDGGEGGGGDLVSDLD